MGAYFINFLALAVAAPGPPSELSLRFSVSGKDYEVVVKAAAIKKAPAWADGESDPPLSARKAIARAREAKGRLLPDVADESFPLVGLDLCPGPAGGWFWQARFEQRGAGAGGRPPFVRVAVLMDGSVVEPVVVPRPKR